MVGGGVVNKPLKTRKFNDSLAFLLLDADRRYDINIFAFGRPPKTVAASSPALPIRRPGIFGNWAFFGPDGVLIMYIIKYKHVKQRFFLPMTGGLRMEGSAIWQVHMQTRSRYR